MGYYLFQKKQWGYVSMQFPKKYRLGCLRVRGWSNELEFPGVGWPRKDHMKFPGISCYLIFPVLEFSRNVYLNITKFWGISRGVALSRLRALSGIFRVKLKIKRWKIPEFFQKSSYILKSHTTTTTVFFSFLFFFGIAQLNHLYCV